jgi:hypothetical protein
MRNILHPKTTNSLRKEIQESKKSVPILVGLKSYLSLLMMIFFLSACSDDGGAINGGNNPESSGKKTNGIHFNTSVTAIKSSTSTG